MARLPKRPLIAVVGATGTGKSQLAVEIARKFDGEIINGDAMQLYKGLPIITNKIKEEEMKGVPHHLLGLVGLHEDTWNVKTFIREATATIEGIRSRGRVPVLVGGTHYYTQSLIFADSLSEADKDDTFRDLSERWPILNEPGEVLLEELRKVDPVMAGRWHPNDHRKIKRSLEIWLETGRRASDIYGEQREKRTNGASPASEDDKPPSGDERSPTNYDTLVFWLHVAQDQLPTRLGTRVDNMIRDGLLDEVQQLDDLRRDEEAAGRPVDLTRGVWPAIGYKEFEPYSAALRSNNNDAAEVQKHKEESIERLKIANRQYAKVQLKRIRIKLLHAFMRAKLDRHLYVVDGSNLQTWHENVEEPTLAVTQAFLEGTELPDPSSLSEVAAEMLKPIQEYDMSDRPDLWEKKTCEECGTVTMTPRDWQRHIASRGHRTKLKKKARRQLVPVPQADTADQDIAG